MIVATPAFTTAGLTGKRRVVAREGLLDQDDLRLIPMIFKLDDERIAKG